MPNHDAGLLRSWVVPMTAAAAQFSPDNFFDDWALDRLADDGCPNHADTPAYWGEGVNGGDNPGSPHESPAA